MRTVLRINIIFIFFLWSFSSLLSGEASAQRGWIYPSIETGLTADDNVFLSNGKEKYSKPQADRVTFIRPGILIEPKMSRHRFILDYKADIQIFSRFPKQNNDNHYSTALLELNYNRLQLSFRNEFNWFSERSGGEDVNRVPRTQEYAGVSATYKFAKVNVSAGYAYKLEDYRTRDYIDNYQSRRMTYEDLNRQNHEGNAKIEFKVWPKTSLLVSGDYGTISHDSGKKSDSAYFDVFVGIKGNPLPKVKVEANIGYRGQAYDHYGDDYHNVVFNGSVVYNLTRRDVLRLDFARTTCETIYLNNAYYEDNFAALTYEHGFTDRFIFSAAFSAQYDHYPTQTTEFFKTMNRQDYVWRGSVGFRYELPVGIIARIKYEYLQRDSNFSLHDYIDNSVTASLTYEF